MNQLTETDKQRAIIEAAFEVRKTISPESAGTALVAAIETAIAGLEQGDLRVAEPVNGEWRVNEWLKKAVLLYFRVRHNQVIDGSASRYFDKVPLRWAEGSDDDISRCGARIVPRAIEADFDQHATRREGGTFFTRLEFTTPYLDLTRPALEGAFADVVAKPFQMDWKLSYSSDVKTTALLVSRADHALLELLWQARRGRQPGARRTGRVILPFRRYPSDL